MRRTVPAALLVALAEASCSSDNNSPSTSICKTTADCNAESATSGHLCVSKACIPCETTEECSGTVYYGSSSVCKSGRCTKTTAGASGAGSHAGAAGRVATGGRASNAGSANAAAGQGVVGGTSTAAGAPSTGGVSVAGSSWSGSGGATAASGGAAIASGGIASATGGVGTAGTTTILATTGGMANGSGSAGSAGLAGSTAVSCPTGSAQLPDGKCKPCGACDPSIPGLTGKLYPLTSRDGLCVCETKDGYYFTQALQSTPELCDADKDGWLRITAKQGIDSDDPAIKDNARCTLRRVEEVKLVNDIGQSKSFYFTSDGMSVATSSGGSLPLYESVANDGGTRSAEQQLPTYGSGPGARALTSAELNSLTKACVNAKADHNGNGLPDVSEWAKLPDSQIPIAATTSGLAIYLPLYTRFSYFVELHTAWFTGTRSETGASFGTYTIQERTRAKTSDGLAVGIIADPGPASEYWRQCDRKRDSGYSDATAGTTYDFASISQPSTSWTGMNHHSQFKCVLGVSGDTYAAMVAESDHLLALHQQTATSLTTRNWYANSCQASSTVASTAADRTNPSAPKIECVTTSALPTDEARWASVTYTRVHGAAAYSYARGCIDECKEKVPAIVHTTCHQCDDLAWGEAQSQSLAAGSIDATCATPKMCDGNGNCGDCVPGTTKCKDSVTQQLCSVARAWEDNVICSFGCQVSANTCFPQCSPTTKRCSGGQPQSCDAQGLWQNLSACGSGTECSGAGVCLKSNGQTCSSFGECAAGTCNTYYQDRDGDGYAGATGTYCGQTPPTGWIATTNGVDCCDTDINAHPGQTGYFATARTGCGGYDYNCSGTDELQYPSGNVTCTLGSSCGGNSWCSPPPACGVAGNFCQCSYDSTYGCFVRSRTAMTQGCR